MSIPYKRGTHVEKQNCLFNTSGEYYMVPECIKPHSKLLKRDLVVSVVVQQFNIRVNLPFYQYQMYSENRY